MMPATPAVLMVRFLGRVIVATGLVLPWLWLVFLDRLLRRTR